jgi:hypothetical protein
MCHHKAERWVDHIIDAIGTSTPKGGLGSRGEGERHPMENVWQAACDALEAWCEGRPGSIAGLRVGERSAAELLSSLRAATALKKWQVARVEERIRSFIGWPRSERTGENHYVPLMEVGAGYESVLRSHCPEEYRDDEELWVKTVQTVLRDQPPRAPEEALLHLASAEISLAVAIDMLMPCNWNFVENLHTVLAAIGGRLDLSAPFAACARHIELAPVRASMVDLCRALRAFCSEDAQRGLADNGIISRLGSVNPERLWLAASLEKTIRSQLDLPA